ncbi:MAG: hypothetical protein IPI06_09420 [Gammaproteobacteria bacterium]|nr:hypothetical protein [Gammaproteobacteria bacterium]
MYWKARIPTGLIVIAAGVLGGQTGAAQPLPPGNGTPGCVDGGGYLRARLRGALTLDLAWRDAEMHCEGGPRPDGRALRVSIAGPEHGGGRRLRFVFGIAGAKEGAPGRALPTNLTVIFEGEERLYATRGEDKCTVDELRQERIGALGGTVRSYRIIARGFCTAPATRPTHGERLLVTTFDFAGRVSYQEEQTAHDPP